MSTPMTLSIQPNQIVKPMRVRTSTTTNMMHVRHRSHMTELAHPVPTLPHLLPTLPIDRVPLASPIRYGPHSDHRNQFRVNTTM